MPVNGLLFSLLPDSWLGRNVACGRVAIVTMKEALLAECKVRETDDFPGGLRNAIEKECHNIEGLPTNILAVRCDKAEKIYARECRIEARKTVDVCIDTLQGLLLVECKYKARPDTSIVQTAETFDKIVMSKFRSTREIWTPQTCKGIRPESIVLFNAESLEKVLNMFMRLKLEDDRRLMFADVHIMNTESIRQYIEDNGGK